MIDKAADMVAEVARTTLERAGIEKGVELYCFGGNGGNFAARVADRLCLDRAYVFALGPVLSAFGSSVAEICHVYEEWGDDHDAIVARGKRAGRARPGRRGATCASRSRSPTT